MFNQAGRPTKKVLVKIPAGRQIINCEPQTSDRAG